MPSTELYPAHLRVAGLHTRIGEYHILHGVDFEVPAGTLCVLLGRNGAGKTTTLRTLMHLWAAHQGEIWLDAQRIDTWETPDIARLGVAYVPEDMGIFGGLSVRENLLLAAHRGRFDSARLDWLLGLFEALKTFWHTPAGHLSGGQKQMLALARAMVEPRRLMLIDEPTKGLSPALVHTLAQACAALKRETTIVLVEQNFQFVRSLGDQVLVMEDGRIVHTGRMADLAADEALQTRLLGLSLAAHQ